MLKLSSLSRISLLISLAVGVSCDGEGPSGGEPDANPDFAAFPAPPDGAGLQLASTRRIEPGEEHIDCRYVALSDEPIEIARFEHMYTPGSHHVVVYPTDLAPDQIGDEQSFDCATRGDLHQIGAAYGASQPEGELAYPPGVAMHFAASSVVLLESHYLNAGTDALDAEVRVNLWYADGPVETEAGSIFFRNWAIYLPPAPGEASAAMRCQLPQDISLLYATSHMHRRGVGFYSQLLRDGQDPAPLHDSDSWATPTPSVYWPPLELGAGDVIEFGCDFRNDQPAAVIEGESADTSEMCIFVAGYWPKMSADAELCLLDGSGPVLSGDATCEQTVDCMLSAGVGNEVGGQLCVADTCAASAQALSSFVVCVERFDCWGDEGCVAASCLDQWTGCTLAKCD